MKTLVGGTGMDIVADGDQLIVKPINGEPASAGLTYDHKLMIFYRDGSSQFIGYINRPSFRFEAGPYALIGASARLMWARAPALLTTGGYSLTGAAATLRVTAAQTLSASPATYLVNGRAGLIRRSNIPLTAAPAAFSMAANAVAFRRNSAPLALTGTAGAAQSGAVAVTKTSAPAATPYRYYKLTLQRTEINNTYSGAKSVILSETSGGPMPANTLLSTTAPTAYQGKPWTNLFDGDDATFVEVANVSAFDFVLDFATPKSFVEMTIKSIDGYAVEAFNNAIIYGSNSNSGSDWALLKTLGPTDLPFNGYTSQTYTAPL